MNRYARFFHGTLVLLLCASMLLIAMTVFAAGTPLFADAFATGDTKAWTLQPPVNALGPIPANGSWKTEGNALVATGASAPWTIQTAGDAGWTDYRLSTHITIRTPAPKANYPIFSGEFDRYLPREDYGDLVQHTGQYRYRYYAGEFDWGSDAAVFVRYQNRNDCYRVQLSTEYQELILWHGVGGYLQVAPCKLEAGRSYTLEVEARGAHLQVFLDGKKRIDYWHTCLPTLTGGIGLAAYRSTIAFQQVKVTALPASTEATPAHQASFSHRVWRGLHWVFDGNEPVVLLEPDPNPNGGDYMGHVMIYHFVKLRPGYRPLYYGYVGIMRDSASNTAFLGNVADIQYSGQGTDQLTIPFDTTSSDKSLLTHHTDVLRYDRVRGTYRHDIKVDITFAKDLTINSTLEFCDPITYNNKEPGRLNKYPWLPAGHRWGVLRSDDGNIYRHPISQSLDIGGQNQYFTKPGEGFWMLYPDRAVCPVFEHHIPGQSTHIGVCHWGYDWHQLVDWPASQHQMKAGSHYTINYTLTGYPPVEGEKLFLASKLHPHMDNAEPADQPILNYLRLPSAYAFPVCDPSGTSFEQLYSVREPYIGWQFYGDYQNDREVGHNDHYSMRLDGPTSASGLIYHHMLDSNAKSYLCTCWLKTKGVKGKVLVHLKYPYGEWGDKHNDVVDTGLTGDHDWTEISFITTEPAISPTTYDMSEFLVEVKGGGTVWLDDFSLRPIADGEQVTEHRPAAVPVAAVEPAKDLLLDLTCSEGNGSSLFDASNHGNYAKLHDVTWDNSGKRPVLHFEKTSLVCVPTPSPELAQTPKAEYPGKSGLTVEAWIRPAAGTGGGTIIGFLYSPQLYLQPTTDKAKYTLNFSLNFVGTVLTLTSDPLIPANAWTHVAGSLTAEGNARLYINGKLVKEQQHTGKLTYSNYTPAITIGCYGMRWQPSYVGDMTDIRWWSRAASDTEIATAAASGQP